MSLADRDYMYEPRQSRHRRSVHVQKPRAWKAGPAAVKAAVWIAALWALFVAFGHVLERRDAKPFPATGDVLWYSNIQRAPLATLTLHAPSKSGRNFAVRLDDWNTGAPMALIPVRPGESSVTLVPLGRYRVTIARGSVWLGSAKLFGRDGEMREGVYPLEFYRRAGVTMGQQ
ncbi:MAG: hypothetical protein ABI589_02980, partial [Burkholderiales bacterium]